MLLRSVKTHFFVANHFSTRATLEKSVQENVSVTVTRSTRGRDTLGRRLLKLVNPKRSAVIAITKWKEEGRTARKYELNRVVRELRKLKRYKHALEICEWMTLQHDIKLVPGDYAVHLDLIAKVRGLNSAEKFFEDLPDQMRGEPTCSALLHVYVQNNMVNKAEALMVKMSECGFLRNPLPYNHMISLYISNGKLGEVPGIIQELKKNTSPDAVTFKLLLTFCALQNDVETAERVFLELKKAKIDPDWVTYSSLTNLYIKSGSPEKAASTLKEMENRTSRKTRDAYSSLLSLHTNMGNLDKVNQIWQKMKECYRQMNDDEYNCMMSSLVKLGDFAEAENIYREWESVSRTNDARVPNILLASYVDRGKMETAEAFYNHIVQKGITPCYTTFELLVRGYLRKKNVGKVLQYFEKATASVKKWNPDSSLVREVFKILEERAHTRGAEQMLIILRNVGHVNTEIYKLLLKTYAKAAKSPPILAKRIKKDRVSLDEETQNLLYLTRLYA